MKKWLSYIFLSVLLITVLLPFHALAAETDWSGELTANENNINVKFTAPKTEIENITSLNFRIYISITNGKMNEPTFQFADTFTSDIKDCAVIAEGSSNYILDIIISGKKDQNIFRTGKQISIGNISLHPTTNAYKATAEFIGITNDSKEPTAKYLTSNDKFAKKVSLVNAKQVTIEKTVSSGSGSSGGSGGSWSISYNSSSNTQAPSATPSATPSTAPSATPSVTPSTAPSATPSITPSNTAPVPSTAPDITPVPIPTKAPATSQQPASFDNKEKPKLKSSVKKGSNYINFSWNKIHGANGYIIYQYNQTNKKYKIIKTISNPNKTKYSIKMSYATSYSCKMRAFKILEDNSKIYGKYSSIVKVTTAPSKVKDFKIKQIKNSKLSLSWEKVKGASGYQIFYSKKKNGQYSLVKTLKKGSVLKTKVKQKNKKTYYYKVRAYITDTNKKNVYGNFSKPLCRESSI